MIGNTRIDYIKIIFWVTLLHSISPICVAYAIASTFYPNFLHLPSIARYWAILETGFFLWTQYYRQHYIQRPANHPPLESRAARDQLSQLCRLTTHDFTAFITKWFYDEPLANIKRENAKDFIRWAFFNTDVINPKYEDEVEEYTRRYEAMLGSSFPSGRGSARCIRLTIDPVNTFYRSLIWYLCIYVVDILTHAYLRYHSYHFYRSSTTNGLAVLPPRPHAFLFSTPSPSKRINYWFHPHTSKTDLPIVFLHGIGVGLYPYMEFLKTINEGRTEEEGTIGVIAIEILGISSRITRPVLTRGEMCEQLKMILDHHPAWERFLLMSHSYGSVISTHILKDTNLASRVTSVLLVDPISILLHHPDVAYNFIARTPTLASEHLLSFFGSKDPGVAHTLSRTFFWSENILWKKDLVLSPLVNNSNNNNNNKDTSSNNKKPRKYKYRNAIVFLAENDSIIDAGKVRQYLLDEDVVHAEMEIIRGSNSDDRGDVNDNNDDDDDDEGYCGEGTDVLLITEEKEKGKNELKESSSEQQAEIEVEWCEGLNHGQIFDTNMGIERLKKVVMREIRI